jgi:catechol 2,3-dioxygenase-like lactoylglutathione lyase family enzyme
MRNIVPILCVRDVAASIAYYRDRLGFTDEWSWGDPPTFGGVRRDDIEIQLCLNSQGNPGTWLSIWVDDVDGLYLDLLVHQADIRQPPTTFEWGVRELNVADPDGHRIRFSQPTRLPPDGVPLAVD